MLTTFDEGRSAVWIVQNLLSHPDATLTCVDPWPSTDAERRFDANVSITSAYLHVAVDGQQVGHLFGTN